MRYLLLIGGLLVLATAPARAQDPCVHERTPFTSSCPSNQTRHWVMPLGHGFWREARWVVPLGLSVAALAVALHADNRAVAAAPPPQHHGHDDH